MYKFIFLIFLLGFTAHSQELTGKIEGAKFLKLK